MKLTIDPGISGTGWALWEDNWKLHSHGVIAPPAKYTWIEKSKLIMEKLSVIHQSNFILKTYVEFPAFFQSAGGQVSARSGALVKLSNLVGAIMFTFSAEPVFVRDWKGSLPKEVVEKRMRRILPNCTATSHAVDAVSMGLYLRGEKLFK